MIVLSLTEIASQPIFYELKDFVRGPVYLKIEGLNIAGSIKLKTAKNMLDANERKYQLSPRKNSLVCSTSGNLGIALSLVCKERGYKLICVVDKNTNDSALKIMTLLGSEICVVSKRDANGGYLANRIALIRQMQLVDSDLFWINQYEDIANSDTHYKFTAQEILQNFKQVDYLFVGAGTTGTLMGCAQYFKEHSPQTQVIAVDAVGWVTFSDRGSKRVIPGLGTSNRPALVNEAFIDEVIHVEEKSTVNMCHHLVEKYGLIVGGSTGTVLSAIHDNYKSVAGTHVAISADLGFHYLQTIYNDQWLGENNLIDKAPPRSHVKSEGMSMSEIDKSLFELGDTWGLNSKGHLSKKYEFENFMDAMNFSNRIAAIAENDNHHPDLKVAYGSCEVEIWTHTVDGLTEGDFRLAAKIDNLKI